MHPGLTGDILQRGCTGQRATLLEATLLPRIWLLQSIATRVRRRPGSATVANISFKLPSEIDEPYCRDWLKVAMAAGKPGPEYQAIRAHAPGVMRSFTMSQQWVYHEGFLEFELKELVRAYIALAGECTYCSNQGVAREIRADREQLDRLFNYEGSTDYTPRQKLAFRYADAIMWDPATADETMWR